MHAPRKPPQGVQRFAARGKPIIGLLRRRKNWAKPQAPREENRAYALWGDGLAIILVYDPFKPVWVSGVFLHVCRGARASVLFSLWRDGALKPTADERCFDSDVRDRYGSLNAFPVIHYVTQARSISCAASADRTAVLARIAPMAAAFAAARHAFGLMARSLHVAHGTRRSSRVQTL
ncbi:hypothetical protein C0Z20_17695 [Trinickia symbiotica]|uniref:Uncharacterized protein n=1 Tax=Trinickia symbiotica TaxID=863227 RepID=A0A2N7X0R1_9BURK|nr:hypothetical protein C0Z20_17695 [Trinickia symbiotica]